MLRSYICQGSNSNDRRELIRLIGFVDSRVVDIAEPPYRARQFDLTLEQAEQLDLLERYRFTVHVANERTDYFKLEDALEAARSGKFDVEDFLNALDG